MVFNKCLALLALVLMLGCQSESGNTANSSAQSPNKLAAMPDNQNKKDRVQIAKDTELSANRFSQQVTVKYVELEGGFYALVDDNGKKYLPLNLAQEYRQPGLKLKITAQLVPDVITIYQWGTAIKIIDVERL